MFTKICDIMNLIKRGECNYYGKEKRRSSYQRLKKDIEKRIECILDEYINTQQNYQAKTLRKFEKDLHNEWADLDFIKLCKK